MKKKLMSIIFALTLIAGLLGTSAYANAGSTDDINIRSVVQLFLKNYTEASMLYVSRSLNDSALYDTGAKQATAEQVFQLSSGAATLSDIRRNIAYVDKKAEFFKAARQLQGISRTDLKLTYKFDSVTIAGDTAAAGVSELASFYYTGETRQTFYETIYKVDLIRLGGRWLVADITDNDWFDAEYKDDPAFSVQDEISAMKTGMTSESNNTVHEIGAESGAGVLTAAPYQLPYNKANAAAYAYTYTRQNQESDWQNYYNPDFFHWHADGDCMNFASQSMWAGFSGDQVRTNMDAHMKPMDSDATYMWYSCSRNQTDGYGNSTASWRSCQYFRQYLTGALDGTGTTGSNAATDIGLSATVLHIAASAAISGTTASNLIGAVGHVLGEAGDFAHAIVLTDASGLARNDIYYCAHTHDRKYVKLGDSYPSCPMKVFIPQYFRTNVPLTNTLRVNMLRPVLHNTFSTVSCATTGVQYKMTIGITNPAGVTTTNSAYNTNSLSYAFNYPTAGKYRVTCYAKPTSSSTVTSVTFYVIAY